MDKILILGIDPGLVATGYGLISVQNGRLEAITCGTVGTDESKFIGQRLLQIEKRLLMVIQKYRPGRVGIELPFVGRDPGAALKLGQVSGICNATLARCGIEPVGFAPRSVKLAVCRSGSASKGDIGRCIPDLVNGANPDSEHSADAYGVAYSLALKEGLVRQVSYAEYRESLFA